MPLPASSGESTKQSGGISVRESRRSFLLPLTSMTVQFPPLEVHRGQSIRSELMSNFSTLLDSSNGQNILPTTFQGHIISCRIQCHGTEYDRNGLITSAKEVVFSPHVSLWAYLFVGFGKKYETDFFHHPQWKVGAWAWEESVHLVQIQEFVLAFYFPGPQLVIVDRWCWLHRHLLAWHACLLSFLCTPWYSVK